MAIEEFQIQTLLGQMVTSDLTNNRANQLYRHYEKAFSAGEAIF